MMNARRTYRRRAPAGVVSIELVLLVPFFALLLFSVYFLGDIMFVQEKLELAARYAAWKQCKVEETNIQTLFFGGFGGRNMVQSIVVDQERMDRRYPKAGGDDAESQTMGALRSPPRFLFDPLALAPHSAETQRTAHIAFEGNTGIGNKATTKSYFGVDQPKKSGGGGWVTNQWGTVVTKYRPMGYTFVSMHLTGAHKVLMGRDYHSELEPGAAWSSSFRFRDAAVTPPLKAGIADTHDDVKGTSWENSGLMKELYPQP